MAVNAIEIQTPKNLMTIVNTDLTEVENQIKKVRKMQKLILGLLVKDKDYGTIPHCGDKPTLFKAGAEKVLMAFSLQSDYDILQSTEEPKDKGFYSYTIKSRIYQNGLKITEGAGQANSKEIKFAFKWVAENFVPKDLDKNKLPKKYIHAKKTTLYFVPDDMNSKANTILKMAKKRAMVDAVLTVCSLSDIFTQDFDDIQDLPLEQTNEPIQIIGEIPIETKPLTALICDTCKNPINQRISDYSKKTFGKNLCFSCQQHTPRQSKP